MEALPQAKEGTEKSSTFCHSVHGKYSREPSDARDLLFREMKPKADPSGKTRPSG
jgi:hypothetical protein